jgi:hypothetical protein
VLQPLGKEGPMEVRVLLNKQAKLNQAEVTKERSPSIVDGAYVAISDAVGRG